MRAIDEIEDHTDIPDDLKTELLFALHAALQSAEPIEEIKRILAPHKDVLPEVTMQLHEWARLCPPSIAPTVYRYTARMAEDMGNWVKHKWVIRTEQDLDRYTYSVAGMVGEMLSELWTWFDGTKSDLVKAANFGRGLQAVNILRNRDEDLERGVDFFPEGWGKKEMMAYTKRNLAQADAYVADLQDGPARSFCKIPLALAHATVKVLAVGGNKLTRDSVLRIVGRVIG